MLSAARSFTEPPGFRNSALAWISTPGNPAAIRASRSSGVLPICSSTLPPALRNNVAEARADPIRPPSHSSNLDYPCQQCYDWSKRLQRGLGGYPMSDYAHPENLVNTEWVARHASDSNVRLVEVDVET